MIVIASYTNPTPFAAVGFCTPLGTTTHNEFTFLYFIFFLPFHYARYFGIESNNSCTQNNWKNVININIFKWLKINKISIICRFYFNPIESNIYVYFFISTDIVENAVYIGRHRTEVKEYKRRKPTDNKQKKLNVKRDTTNGEQEEKQNIWISRMCMTWIIKWKSFCVYECMCLRTTGQYNFHWHVVGYT